MCNAFIIGCIMGIKHVLLDKFTELPINRGGYS